jgi:SAM-dependent methyltransferase
VKVNPKLQLTHPDNPYLCLRQENGHLVCEATGETFPVSNGIPRLVRDIDQCQAQTKDGFSYKWERNPDWGKTGNHRRVFLQAYREWFGVNSFDDFARYMKGKVLLNAGCGCGRNEYFWGDFPSRVVDLDISRAIDVAKKNWGADPRFSFIQGDVLKLPFADQTFDVVWSEGVLHHTPSTADALASCVRVLKPGGIILFYIYRKKAPLREFADDHIRKAIADLPPDQAWAALEPLTQLAKAFSDLKVDVEVPADVDLLGFKAGTYNVQRFLYYNVMKFYWNDEFTFEENVHLNYDWYYPRYCWRHTVDEVRGWLQQCGLEEMALREADSGIGVIAQRRVA